MIEPSYFETMRIPLLAGRSFSRTDARDAPRVAIVSQRLAQAHWPDASPIGARLRLSFGFEAEIIGVVGNVRLMQGHVSPEKADSLMKESGSKTTAYLFDPDGRVGRLYGAKATPHMFVIDPDGKVVYQGAIDSIRSSDPADIAIAQNYVRIALADALAGNPIEVTDTRPYGCSIKYGK